MRILLAAALLASVPVVASADPTPDVQKMATDDCARARKQNKTCVLSIEHEIIDGDHPKGDLPAIVIPIDTKLGSLIRIRRDFIVAILKSAEDI